MKKLLLGVVTSFFALEVVAQVVVAGISPVAIQRNFDYGVQANEAGWPLLAGQSDDGTWAMALDFNIDGTYIQGELVLVDDGTPGTNTTYGNLLSEEGCAASPAGAYAGKIAVIRRNTCNFSLKMFNAQQAGAIGVIIVNREDASIGMSAGPDGVNVTIPGVIISKTDGNQLIDEMANGPVVMFIGNKFGIFNNDLGSDPSNTIIATQASTPSILAQNGTEFSFTPGIQVVNYGLSTQSDIYVTATVAAPGNPTAYSEVLGPLTLNYKDTAAIFAGYPDAFPAFALSSYPVGEYTLTYTISLGVNTDEAPGDNAFTSKFYVTEDIFSYARHNATDGEPVVNSFPKNYTEGYKSCIRFNDANADRAGVLGLYTAVSIDTSQFPLGQQIQLFGYKWNDAATSVSPAATGATYDALVQVAYASFDAIETAGFLNGEEVFIPFETPFILENNQNYLFCVITETPEPAFGYDNGLNYNANMGISNNVTFPIFIDNTGTVDDAWFSAGWNGSPAPSIGLQLFPAAELGISETSTIEANAYPNPTNDNVTITMNVKGTGNLVVTDITGKIVMNNAISLANGQSNVNMSSLEAGLYIFNITLDNGKTAQFNVVKK